MIWEMAFGQGRDVYKRQHHDYDGHCHQTPHHRQNFLVLTLAPVRHLYDRLLAHSLVLPFSLYSISSSKTKKPSLR